MQFNKSLYESDHVWKDWLIVALLWAFSLGCLSGNALDFQQFKYLRLALSGMSVISAGLGVTKVRQIEMDAQAIAQRRVMRNDAFLEVQAMQLPSFQQQPMMMQQQPGQLMPVVNDFDWHQVLTAAHVAIVGKTGSGKSALCQWLAANLGATDISVYDSDASPSEWQGLSVTGRGANYRAIAESMQSDLDELQRRTDARANGQHDFEPKIIILEESPETLSALKDNDIEVGYKWLKAILRRGRKYGIKLILLSQGFSVRSLRIDGEGELRDNIAVLRLGNVAIKHGKTHLELELQQLLKQQPRPLLLDDECVGCVPDLTGFLQSQQTGDRQIILDKFSANPHQTEPPQRSLLNRLFQLGSSDAEPLEPVTEEWDGTGDIPSSYTAVLVQGIRSGLSKNQIITELLLTPKGGSKKYKALSRYHDEVKQRIL